MTIDGSSAVREVELIRRAIRVAAETPLERATTLPAITYTSEAFFEYEKETIFKKEWICVAHVSQIPKAGDYLNLDVIGEPITVVHDERGDYHVLSRVCPHRGMDIMPSEFGYATCGSGKRLMCPYHSWTFDLRGRVVGAPEMKKTPGFRTADYALHAFRSEVWEGFVFMTFDADVEPLAVQYADLLKDVAAWKMADMVINISFEWDCPFNWKNMIENWMEPYHHMGRHVKTLQPLMPATGCWTEAYHPHFTRAHLPYRKTLVESIEAAEAKGRKPAGFLPIAEIPEAWKYEWTVHVGYPLYMMLTAPDRILWYRLLPQSAERCHLLTTTLVRREALADPDYAKALEVETPGFRDFHLEDMELCTATQRGFRSVAYKPGPLCHLEAPIPQIHRYLFEQMARAEARAAAGAG